MSLKKEMNRDEHGYINGRGTSKYWGVTTQTNHGKKTWVVSHGPKWSAKTLGHRANGFTLKEVDAARIAAFLFEQSQYADKAPEPVYVRSADGKHVFAVDPAWSLITRSKNTGSFLCYSPKPNLLLSDAMTYDLSKEIDDFIETRHTVLVSKDRDREENRQILMMLNTLDEQPSTVMNDRELITLVTESVLSKSLTKTGAQILIGVLSQVA
jgi:hypothetical protein